MDASRLNPAATKINSKTLIDVNSVESGLMCMDEQADDNELIYCEI